MPIRLNVPIKEDEVRSLKVGDMVLISGKIVTARDLIHKYLYEKKLSPSEIPFELKDGVLYHCGPIIKINNKNYKFVVGGPTTSYRMEMYEWFVIKKYGLRGIIGKGGMGKKTLEALKETGCVYLHTISGASVYLAECVKDVLGVWKAQEFGLVDAMWQLTVSDFPAVVTMDTHGRSLHDEIKMNSLKNLKNILKSV